MRSAAFSSFHASYPERKRPSTQQISFDPDKEKTSEAHFLALGVL